MNTKLKKDDITERLRVLSNTDRKRAVFGSSGHDYLLKSPLDVSEIEVFEAKYNIRLPEDYRRFVTEIGNGGAGPAYGFFQFGYEEDGRWGEHLPFGDPGTPFPHSEAWNLGKEFFDQEPDIQQGMSRDDEDRLVEKWDSLLEERYWSPAIMDGAIPICHLGCGLLQWLVVHGEQQGFVWDDMRADHGGIAPVKDENGDQVTFTDWYSNWLTKIESGEGRILTPSSIYGAHPRVPLHRDLLTLLLLIVLGVLLALAREWFLR
ncbi:SMI1/KNR4 family protein [Fuerstiella marisgermanici]|uniref:SMI1 / KNR4 family protein n=1 Tax=Fuerstiella marisgermanici TaxID=1891926 RepID=A0A1P8WH06_9PLAN|nr:SMI1/KNR4 family protein [Fuerstiella marisgermanici]APZ93332.1 SMI1 / KNR4 family protein [Fuerstiella marisgermanici]